MGGKTKQKNKTKQKKNSTLLCDVVLELSKANCSSMREVRCHRLCDLPRYLSRHGLMRMGGTHNDKASENVLMALG